MPTSKFLTSTRLGGSARWMTISGESGIWSITFDWVEELIVPGDCIDGSLFEPLSQVQTLTRSALEEGI